jgi:hypothetical protein
MAMRTLGNAALQHERTGPQRNTTPRLRDRAIAGAYELPLRKSGSNGERYWFFMIIMKDGYIELASKLADCPNPLKWIDEYNYCEFTKHWGDKAEIQTEVVMSLNVTSFHLLDDCLRHQGHLESNLVSPATA